MKRRELIRRFTALGFVLVRTGEHHVYQRGRSVFYVPIHGVEVKMYLRRKLEDLEKEEDHAH